MKKRKFAVLRLLAGAAEIDAVCRALQQYAFQPQYDSETPASAFLGTEKKSGGESPYGTALSHLRFVLDVAGELVPQDDVYAELPED